MTKSLTTVRAAGAAALFVLAGAAHAESLMYRDLVGFQDGHQTNQGPVQMVEWVPKGESLKDWSRMVTVNVLTPAQPVAVFQKTLTDLWHKACPSANATPVRDGVENGYSYVLWLLSCQNNPATGKPEYTFVKAIEGRQKLYAAQYAFRHRPSDTEVREATLWLRDVLVATD